MNKRTLRKRRQVRIRARVTGTKSQPRMSIFRSLNHIYIQFIDDEAGRTLATASSKEVKSKLKKTEMAAEVGKLGAQKAQQAGIKKVVFDRGGNLYHGRIKQLAEAARAAGLEF